MTGRFTLPQEARPAFEEGVSLVCSNWTALGLAVENEWGGRNSREKADQLIADTIAWFYSKKGARPPPPLTHTLAQWLTQRNSVSHPWPASTAPPPACRRRALRGRAGDAAARHAL